MALIIIGLVMAAIGVLGDHTHHKQYTWAAFYSNALFFFFIALGTLFFYALNHITETGWTVLVKRVYESITTYLAWGALPILLVLVAGSIGMHHIFPWMDGRTLDTNDPLHYDAHIDLLSTYLNKPFFWIRTLVIMGTFVFFARWFRSHSLRMDSETGETLMRSHWKNYHKSVLFIQLRALLGLDHEHRCALEECPVRLVCLRWNVGQRNDRIDDLGTLPQRQGLPAAGERKPHSGHGQMDVCRQCSLGLPLL